MSLTLILSIFGVDTAGAFAAQDSGIKNSGFGARRLGTNCARELSLNGGSIVITDSGYSVGGGAITGYTGPYRITGASTSNTVTVQSGTEDITIQSVSIDVSVMDNTCAFFIAKDAVVNLTLEGANTLKCGMDCAGLRVPGDGSYPLTSAGNAFLTVTAQSTGSLTATGGEFDAGIGGGDDGVGAGAGGSITINGGTVMANGGNGGGSLIVGNSNTAEPLLELLSAGTNGTNPDNSRPQFMNCVMQGAGADSQDISGFYDENGKIRLVVTMPTPASGTVGLPVTLNATVTKYNPDARKYQFTDPTLLSGTVQFTTVSGSLLGSSLVTNGTARSNWTPTNKNTVWLKATYVPTADDRFGSAGSSPNAYAPGKMTPTVSALPTASAVTAGSPLAASTLSGGTATVPGAFSWADQNRVVTVSDNYEVIFTPEDTDDYNTVSGFMVPVTVPTAPTPQINFSHSTTAPSLPASVADTPHKHHG